MKGYYHDLLIGCQGQAQWGSGWRSNLVVHQCDVLLAALMKRQSGLQGILYWAVGEGEKEWDALCPGPRATDIRLSKEIARLRLEPQRIMYLDGSGQESGALTNCLEITAKFKGEDLVSNGFQSLREFGLFGGNAEEKPDSGFLIDYVIHPRIDLAPGDTLSRKLRLTFGAGGVQRREEMVGLTGFGANLPVNSIDGVGAIYAGVLQEHGVYSLGSLAEIDSLSAVKGIPPVKLREFRAKARLVMRLRVDPPLIEPFAEYDVSRFLRETPESLTRPGVPSDRVMYLQEALADLQIALDDAQLQGITLADLMSE